ncbi:BQ2448_3012 [Microbotryum intermedium]|uniref:Carboxypeptidase n=1 Tax=Microbotryum intermedium TaxID=269621 RepID=A0A238FHR3_9BASI|nr:BQ2448_3012 [Microbotryum intermedium]
MRVGLGARAPPPDRRVDALHTTRATPVDLLRPVARAAADPAAGAGVDDHANFRLPTAAELYISDLPGLPSDETTSLFGGTLPATAATSSTSTDNPDAHLYFLMAQPRHIPNRHRLIIWFNGGPGCSSFDGAFIENGPLRVNKDGKTLQRAMSSWNEYATVIFLDQPAGTGFSYASSDFVTEFDTAADQVVEFLINLDSIFPELSTMDTYLAGESYAGQYIPYIASAILETTRIKIPLKGLVMGNGWYSPKDQYPAYLDCLVDRKLISKGSTVYKNIEKATEECLVALKEIEKKDPQMKGSAVVGTCEQILNAITEGTKKDELCLNQYDTSLHNKCGAEWPPEVTQLQRYLRQPKVVSALHALKGARWSQCSSAVGSRFWASKSVPSVALLPKLLDEEIPWVFLGLWWPRMKLERMGGPGTDQTFLARAALFRILLYSGDRDLMCCGLGVERMIEGLEWGGFKGFNDAPALDWTVDGRLAGSWKSARGLTFVNVLDASHMVPRDQPLAAHDMILRFMRVDTLHAAGAAARVPSHIQGSSEQGDTVLGVTTPEGETLVDVVPLDPDSPLLERPPGSVGNVQGGEGVGSSVPGGSGLGGAMEGGTALGKGGLGQVMGGIGGGGALTAKQHEALYGPRRTLVLVVFLVVGGLGMWAWLRWRRKRRIARRIGKGKGREKRGSGDYVRLGERRRGRGGSIRLDEEETMRGREFEGKKEDRIGFGVPSRSSGGEGASSSERRHGNLAIDTRQVFDIGEEDEEEEEEGEEGDDHEEEEEVLGDLGASPGRTRRRRE